MNRPVLYLIISILISFGAFYYVSGEIKAFSKEIDAVASKQEYYNPKIVKNKVVISNPQPNLVITNPLTIKGNILGTWFFEGEIVSKIIDTNGVVLGQGPLVATQDWMTVKNVSFSGVIPFVVSSEKAGFLVIEAQNQDKAEDSSAFKIPIRFGDISVTACVGDSCGECAQKTIGTDGVCIHQANNKTL
ncbi:MAG: hypothetical protein JWP09_898 [Candidatus Taylorbacteria bacterium]|nr:hypothetical protein [Candidatus Taylorbacteria bacterium]